MVLFFVSVRTLGTTILCIVFGHISNKYRYLGYNALPIIYFVYNTRSMFSVHGFFYPYFSQFVIGLVIVNLTYYK